MGNSINENPDRYVAKVEYRAERVTTMRVKTKYKGETIIIINPHAPDTSYGADIRKE